MQRLPNLKISSSKLALVASFVLISTLTVTQSAYAGCDGPSIAKAYWQAGSDYTDLLTKPVSDGKAVHASDLNSPMNGQQQVNQACSNTDIFNSQCGQGSSIMNTILGGVMSLMGKLGGTGAGGQFGASSFPGSKVFPGGAVDTSCTESTVQEQQWSM